MRECQIDFFVSATGADMVRLRVICQTCIETIGRFSAARIDSTEVLLVMRNHMDDAKLKSTAIYCSDCPNVDACVRICSRARR